MITPAFQDGVLNLPSFQSRVVEVKKLTVLFLPQHLNRTRFFLLGIASLILIASATIRAEAYPADNEWVALLRNGVLVQDPNGDAQGSRNVVSDPDHAAAFFANDGTNLCFRMRLDDDPSGTGGQGAYKSFGWGFEIDTNLNAGDYEWLIMLDGLDKNENISLQQNTVQQTLGDPSDKSEIVAATYSPVTSYSRVVPADTLFNGDQDYFLDFFIPYSEFLAHTGLSDNSPIRFFEGSSSNAKSLTERGADLVGASDLYAGFSDYLTPAGQIATTGTVTFVEALDGSGDVTEINVGDTIYIAVNDNDQNLNLSVPDTVTVVLTSGVGDTETITLTETGANTGIFTASIPSDTGAVASEDGTLQVAYGDTITATYNDAVDADGNINQTRTDTCAVAGGGFTGTLESTPSIIPGDTVTLTLTDADLNTNSGSIETVQLTTTNTVTGETELLTYTETGPDTGVFVATVNTAYGTTAGTNDDGTFNVKRGDTLSTTYNDALTATGGAATVTATTTVVQPLFTITKAVDKTSADPGEILTYTLTYENIGDGNAKDVYFIDTIPENTTYVIGSAAGAGTTIQFQHVNGGPFDSSETAPVTAIMWLLTEPLPPGGSGTLTLQVKIN